MTTNNQVTTIKLDQFLKWQNLLQTGGEAKRRIQGGEVLVNGTVETRRGRKLVTGDVVTIDRKSYQVPELTAPTQSTESCRPCDV